MDKYKCYFKEQVETKLVREQDLTPREWDCSSCKDWGENSKCFEYVPLYLTRFYQNEIERRINGVR